jgi:hypothetical protein
MNFKSITFLVFMAVALSANAANIVSNNNNKVVVDGNAKEWANPLPYFDKTTTIRFDVSNDAKKINFILRVDDLELQRGIMQNGMEIWINKDGKKNQSTGIIYPCPTPTKASASDETASDKNEVFLIDSLTLKGFFLENGKQPIRNCDVRVSIAKGENNCLIYEVSIPFTAFWKEELEKADTKKKFNIGFILKAQELPGMRNAGMGMGMGMMMGGGMGGDMGGMRMPSARAMKEFLPAEYQDKAYWFKVQLSNAF